MRNNINGGAAARIKLIAAMLIFGTIGLFVRRISLPSSVTALARGIIGTLFLLAFSAIKKERLSASAIKRNLPVLCVSGIAIGINWILFFEAYRYTTVATATLCYYFAPVFVILMAPILFKERLTLNKVLCLGASLLGMVFVSGVLQTSILPSDVRGMALGLGAAVFYAAVMLLNKKLTNISAYEKTITQLAAASVVLIPYVLVTEDISALRIDTTGVVLLLVVGVVHTGAAYALYFGAMRDVPAHTTAILSYIDPATAVVLSCAVLKEPLGLSGAVGTVLILGSAVISELTERKCSGQLK